MKNILRLKLYINTKSICNIFNVIIASGSQSLP